MNVAISMAKKIKENPFKSLTNIIYEILLEKIVSYDYIPHGKLCIADLSNELSVSKTPVKQAIAMLEDDGFVYTIKNRGTFFSPFELDDYINFLKLRIALETSAISKATENIGDLEIKQISLYLNDLFDAYNQENYSLIFSSEENFHSYIIKCSKNKYIINAYNNLSIYIKRFRIYVAMNKSCYKTANIHHRHIYETLLMKDQKYCEAAIKSHLELGLKSLLENKHLHNNNNEIIEIIKKV